MKHPGYPARWWAYLIGPAIALLVGFRRNWDNASWVVIGFVVLINCMRLLLPYFRNSTARKLARMSPEERERSLSRFHPEARSVLEETIRNQSA